MGNVTLYPYIFFTGNCREAMEFYKTIFGGELTVQTYDKVPGPPQKEMKGKVMHAGLTGGEIELLASDTQKASPKAAKVSLSLNGTDQAKLTKIFSQLSEGVEAEYPLKKEFWGDIFGTVIDKFGVDWMVSISPEKN